MACDSHSSVYILGGSRTPIGSFLGNLSSLSAPQLGSIAITGAINNSGIMPEQINEVYMGVVLSAGQGQAPARQAAIGAGIPSTAGAVSVNKVCGSGLQTIWMAQQSIVSGAANLVVAGGMESMSNVPHLLQNSRTGSKLGHQQLTDSLIFDGLWDAYNHKHMGECAEACAEKYGYTQATQDAYAAESYRRAQHAVENHLFKAEIAPVSIPNKKGDPTIIEKDEEPFKGNIEKLPSLRPAFIKEGTITAGNASTLNDGAAALIIAGQSTIDKDGLKPKAKIIAIARYSGDPLWFTTAPVGAIKAALEKAKLSINDIDCFEINEAFSAVAMAAIDELKLDSAKVNPRGGAVALGHPIGASGTRIVVTLINTLEQTNGRYGLASLCIGGGEALAIVIEKV